jgi:hypothetical protein
MCVVLNGSDVCLCVCLACVRVRVHARSRARARARVRVRVRWWLGHTGKETKVGKYVRGTGWQRRRSR